VTEAHRTEAAEGKVATRQFGTAAAMTIEELIAAYRLPERTVTVSLDGEALERVEQLTREVAVADVLDARAPTEEPSAPALRAQLAEAEELLEASVVHFRLRALGGGRFRELIAEHPSKVQGERFDLATFTPALLAECSVEPKLELVDAHSIMHKWSSSATTPLIAAALQLCEGSNRR
jgi:sulfur carrier protein ThiS